MVRRRVLLELAGAAGAAALGGAYTWFGRRETGSADRPLQGLPGPGPLRWAARVDFAQPEAFGPVAGGRLFLVDRSYSAALRRDLVELACLDTGSGRRLWSAEVSRAAESVPRAVAAGGAVLIRSGGALLALDPATGAVRWKRERRAPAAGISPVIPVTPGGGLVYDYGEDSFPTGFGPEALQALDPASGRVRWLWRGQGESLAGVPVFGGVTTYAVRLLVGDGARTEAIAYGLNAATGAVRWRRPLGAMGLFAEVTMTYGSGRLYVSVGGQTLHALDATAGTLQWSARTGSRAGEDVPVVSGSSVIVRAGNGVVYAFSAQDGKKRWEFAMAGAGSGRLLIGNGTIYTGDGSTLYALRVADGRLLWKHALERSEPSPLLAGGLVYVPARGAIVGHDPADGAVRRRVELGGWTPGAADGLISDGVCLYVLATRAVLCVRTA